MQESLLSPYWYRVAHLHPHLRPHVSVRMQITRGHPWYVLFNQATGRHHRVNAQAYQLVGRLDGRRSVDEVWHVLLEQLGDDAPSQHDVIRIMGQMTDAGLIQAEAAADVRQLVRSDGQRQRQEKRARLNPLAFRLGLFNPSRLLERLLPVARLLWSPWATALWLMLVVGAGLLTLLNLQEVVTYSHAHFMSPGYLAAAWVVYPLMKAVHELGHALALRRYGCEVPEVGVNFFMFVPMPFVDASASNRLVNRWQRARISAAGIGVELALAAVAAFLWFSVEEGAVRQVAFVVMSLGGLSTLLFNGNPLMKLDGYYVLCDVLDLPNLGGRSGKTLQHFWRAIVMTVLGLRREAADAAVSAGDGVERVALWAYAPLSWSYRCLVGVLIVGWAAEKAALLGAVVALWSVWTLVVRPVIALAQSVMAAPGALAARGRVALGGGVVGVVVLGALAWVPMPSSLVVEGMVWLPDDALIRASADGEVDTVWVRSERGVSRGEALITLRAPALEAQQQVLQAQVERAESEYNAAFGLDPLKMKNAQEAVTRDRAALAQVDKDLADLVLRAAVPGRFILSRQEDLEGGQVTRGDVLAYVLSDRPTVIRALVRQQDIDAVRHRLKGVEVMLDEQPGKAWPARWLREVPASADRLPAAVMGDRAGGRVATNPEDPEGLRPSEPMYVIDLELQQALPRAGGLARARLSLTSQSVLETATQRLRQLFLRHFPDLRL